VERLSRAEFRILGCSVTLQDADDIDPAPATRASGTILDVVANDPDAVAAAMVDASAEVVFQWPVSRTALGVDSCVTGSACHGCCRRSAAASNA
jgi:uncharacterized glyoxalase superfamily protein PhnB